MMTPPSLPVSTSPRVRSALWVLAGLSAAVLFIGAIVVVTQIFWLSSAIRDTQINNTQRAALDRTRDEDTKHAAEAAARAVQRIEDCTTPGMQCFEDAQKRTGEAVAGINQGTLAVIVAALSCQADGITEQEALAECTVKRAREAPVR